MNVLQHYVDIMETTFRLKRDSYRDTRGGYARFLNIYCAGCGSHVLLYQKDGPGVLYRLYLDRIFAPEELANRQFVKDLKQLPELLCTSCGALLGTPTIWQEENRSAYQLTEGSVVRKVGRGIYPPAETTR
jgi:ribosomal protein S27E